MLFSTEFTDLDFVKTLGLKIIAGRDLSESFTTDSCAISAYQSQCCNKLGYTP
jgi:putative ABC transport system permease protein